MSTTASLDLVLDRLADAFTSAQLERAITETRAAASEKLQLEESLQDIRWLAHSNYQLELSAGSGGVGTGDFPPDQQ